MTVLQKVSKAWQKELVRIIFFWRVLFEAGSEAGYKDLQVNMGKTKPERSSESVAKASNRMAKKLVCINFFLTRLFWQILKLDATVHYSKWGRQNQKEAPKVLQKLPHAWQKTSLYYFFLTRFFWSMWSWAQLLIIQYGEDKTRKKPRKCCKSY